jgi:1,3-beta-glucan synthase
MPTQRMVICDTQVSEEDFCEGGALAHLQMELQLWAAYRGQLLARTVRGTRGH